MFPSLLATHHLINLCNFFSSFKKNHFLNLTSPPSTGSRQQTFSKPYLHSPWPLPPSLFLHVPWNVSLILITPQDHQEPPAAISHLSAFLTTLQHWKPLPVLLEPLPSRGFHGSTLPRFSLNSPFILSFFTGFFPRTPPKWWFCQGSILSPLLFSISTCLLGHLIYPHVFNCHPEASNSKMNIFNQNLYPESRSLY